jgi:hypothetical protein
MEKFALRLAMAAKAKAAPIRPTKRPISDTWFEDSHAIGPDGKKPTPTKRKLAASEAMATNPRLSRRRGYLLIDKTTAAPRMNEA